MCAKMSSWFSRDFATVLANIVFPEPWEKYLNVKCIVFTRQIGNLFLWPDQQYEVDMKESLSIM